MESLNLTYSQNKLLHPLMTACPLVNAPYLLRLITQQIYKELIRPLNNKSGCDASGRFVFNEPRFIELDGRCTPLYAHYTLICHCWQMRRRKMMVWL